ncbi:MAG: DUF1572 family protein [Acidobacteria bacterium]|nr:DUF1572 family protein [Acidobacteriota bacterium]
MAGRLVVDAFEREFQKTRQLCDRSIAQLSEEQLHIRLDAEANSVAMLMQHLAGNMRSRWTDFLTTDGEKPWRQRDAEFEPPARDHDALMASWQSGWQVLADTLATLTDDDLTRTVTIRGEGQSVLAALTRQLAHYAGHAYQIVLVAKHLKGDAWHVLSIPRGGSAAYTAATKAATGA